MDDGTSHSGKHVKQSPPSLGAIGDSDDAGNAAVPVLDRVEGHGVSNEAENPPPETVEATDGADATFPLPKRYDWSRLPVYIRLKIGRKATEKKQAGPENWPSEIATLSGTSPSADAWTPSSDKRRWKGKNSSRGQLLSCVEQESCILPTV